MEVTMITMPVESLIRLKTARSIRIERNPVAMEAMIAAGTIDIPSATFKKKAR
jgi:hypothetical protein